MHKTHQPQFAGKLDFAPMCPDHPTDERTLESDFGFATSWADLIVCVEGSRVNGASIPRGPLRWPLGHPLSERNKFWSVPHDCGYNGTAIIINMRHPICAGLSPDVLLELWGDLPDECFIYSRDVSRRWWDLVMVEAMEAMGEPRWKQRVVYWGVRVGGAKSYRKKL